MGSPNTIHTRADLARAAVPAGYAQASTIMALVPLMHQFGVDLHEVLAESGLPLAILERSENLVPFRHGSHLLGLCADRSNCAHLGLLVGRHSPIESLGMLADLVRAAAHVRSALGLLMRYLKLSDSGGLLALHEDSRFVTCSYALYEPEVERTEIVYDIAIGTLWNVLRALCGPAWRPQEVLFPRRRPADIRPYRSFLRAPLRFNCEQCAIVFERHWLDAPLPSADPRRLRMLKATARVIEAQLPDQILTKVREAARRQLLSGSISMNAVALDLDMHRRTLDRHLKGYGMSFKAFTDELRFELSRQLLRNTEMPVAEVAQSLHYANAGAFSTAFRRWSGTSPSKWRFATRMRGAIVAAK